MVQPASGTLGADSPGARHGAGTDAPSVTRRAELWRRIGCALPLIQAPMAGVQGTALALAVSRADGLGSLPAALLSPEALQAALAELQTGLRQGPAPRPYNLNFFCHPPPGDCTAEEAAWRAALAPFYDEFGVDPSAASAGGARAPFSATLCDLIEPFRPPVLSFHFGLPAAPLLQRAKAWGAVVLASATTVDEGRWLQDHGVDAVIAQGLEAGGHRGHFLSDDLSRQQGLSSLLPALLQAVQVPVIAAGGIGTADDVAAVMRLGAAGVQAGTAYLLSDEATTSPLHRQALMSDAARHTALTRLFTGRPARGIVNRLMRALGPLNPVAPPFPQAAAALAPLRAAAEARGLPDFTPLWSGQHTSACRAAPAADITEALARGLSGPSAAAATPSRPPGGPP
ncbi:MAG: NAD(P)H-dependent flavin oxidoreductase [Rubrivivax sp.]|jgi:nitronate monooxygenase